MCMFVRALLAKAASWWDCPLLCWSSWLGWLLVAASVCWKKGERCCCCFK
jgi:hypothetical protein